MLSLPIDAAPKIRLIRGEAAPKETSGGFFMNFGSSIAVFALTALINLWYAPFLIHRLGVAAYGLIPLATLVTAYLSVLTLTLNATTGRYLTIALESGDARGASRLFSASFFGNILALAILAPIFAVLSVHADRFFVVPPGFENGFRWLFGLTAAAFFVTGISASFDVVSYCRNRFDLRNLSSSLSLIVRVGFVWIAFSFWRPSVVSVGIGVFLSAIVSLGISWVIWKRLLPDLRIRFRDFNFTDLKKMLGTSAWMLLNQLGTMLILGVDLILANRLFGAVEAGRYASVLQWSALLRAFATLVAGIFGPPILSLYARNDMESLVAYARRAVKFMGLLMALPVGLVCGLAPSLLRVWLGTDFVSLAFLLSLLTAHLCINLGYLPLHQVLVAANKVRVPGMVQIVAAAGNLFLAIFLARTLGWGITGIAFAGLATLTLKNVIFTPIYAARVIGQPLSIFMKELWPISLLTLFLAALARFLSSHWQIVSYSGLFAAAISAAAVYACIVWVYFLNHGEKSVLADLLRKGVKT